MFLALTRSTVFYLGYYCCTKTFTQLLFLNKRDNSKEKKKMKMVTEERHFGGDVEPNRL